MATTAMDYESANGDRYDDDGARYDRRSASPRASREDDPVESSRRRSASPGANADRAPKHDNGSRGGDDDDGAINPGSNLFVTGIHPRLSEAEVTRLFEKYGEVEKCQIMKDPHTKESRGFGFVKMVTSDQADAAKDGLQGEVIEGRTLSIEKARRARPRTPTPGKYFGPPKREGGGGGRPRFDDRRRGGGYGGRDDSYRGYRGDRGYGGREDRGYGGREERGYRDDRGYSGGRDDRSYARRDDRGYDRGYSGGREDRGYGGGRGGEDRGYSGGREERSYGGGRGGEDRGYNGRDDRSYGSGRRDRDDGGYADAGARAEPRDTYSGAQ
ncbi:uncharacterized protein B0I36DRAFT_361571 [Microdochium trichocladiopsis]|uniref:RRM domain-containing protein n=1 Tax=Microdochium trichocladiopsis TaxID=1682393 RepID=A0A9P8Y654_9PEZI|nr:uncharacterized protein B0I36DRAFT_361571 [Microdochium trichocladiopsis]KAH7032805.1 hypothetical protein B0I36DRAFT_361571 [Microdochium trichocladiopsis]